MPICPVCNARWPAGQATCPLEGATLVQDVDGAARTHPSEPPQAPTSLDDVEILSRPDPELEAGASVGEYLVEAKVGEGSFGTVYRAAHPLIGKRVAIKVLSGSYSADAQVSARFLSEAQAVNRIAHPNIVDIFSFGRLADGRLYYVMEYLDGESLDKRLAQKGRLSLSEAAKLLRPIARALDAAAARGVAHRDLKPANVMLGTTADGEVVPKLVDFGIAKILGADRPKLEQTATGSPIGTPYYMSPEQCRAEAVDPKTDVYAFGVMLYQVLTGELPFKGPSFLEIMMKHVERDPVAPSRIRPSLGAQVDRLVLSLMAKSPDARPAKLVPVIDELGLLAVRSVDLEASIPPEEITAPFVKLRPLPRLPIALALVAAILSGTWWATREPEEGVADPAPDAGLADAPPEISEVPEASAEIIRTPVTPSESATVAARIRVEIVGTPAGTRVFLGDKELGTVPGPLELTRAEAPVSLTFKAKGFLPRTEVYVPTGDGRIKVKLQKAPKPRRARADEIEDVDWGR
ncbi:MAG: serine/threonine protein kinase [Deltaproteobacteria bacterium]|nr:serine/threonine protein kinase [Deltaproteobacteria bacterium]